MTEKTLKIQTQTWEDAKEKALEKARKFDDGEEVTETSIIFVEPSDVQRLLTPKRLELIQTLMTVDVGSIRELAEVLGRNPSEVHDDVHTLEEYGVVELREEGRAKKPVVPYDDIDINVSISRKNAVSAHG
ncbi:transcriptional regulator [Halorutilales archaeon Cl-col2-1]|nr:transcriptional regulator [Halobacteria archaeon]